MNKQSFEANKVKNFNDNYSFLKNIVLYRQTIDVNTSEYKLCRKLEELEFGKITTASETNKVQFVVFPAISNFIRWACQSSRISDNDIVSIETEFNELTKDIAAFKDKYFRNFSEDKYLLSKIEEDVVIVTALVCQLVKIYSGIILELHNALHSIKNINNFNKITNYLSQLNELFLNKLSVNSLNALSGDIPILKDLITFNLIKPLSDEWQRIILLNEQARDLNRQLKSQLYKHREAFLIDIFTNYLSENDLDLPFINKNSSPLFRLALKSPVKTYFNPFDVNLNLSIKIRDLLNNLNRGSYTETLDEDISVTDIYDYEYEKEIEEELKNYVPEKPEFDFFIMSKISEFILKYSNLHEAKKLSELYFNLLPIIENDYPNEKLRYMDFLCLCFLKSEELQDNQEYYLEEEAIKNDFSDDNYLITDYILRIKND